MLEGAGRACWDGSRAEKLGEGAGWAQSLKSGFAILIFIVKHNWQQLRLKQYCFIG